MASGVRHLKHYKLVGCGSQFAHIIRSTRHRKQDLYLTVLSYECANRHGVVLRNTAIVVRVHREVAHWTATRCAQGSRLKYINQNLAARTTTADCNSCKGHGRVRHTKTVEQPIIIHWICCTLAVLVPEQLLDDISFLIRFALDHL